MTFYERSYAWARENAAHLKALGESEVYLRTDDPPWHLVTNCEPGGSHRLEISTSVRFTAFDPACGLKFSWSFDIEPLSANGSGSYHIDVEACRSVVAKLSGEARADFRDYLADCARKVRAKADEWQAVANRQKRAADALDLASQA